MDGSESRHIAAQSTSGTNTGGRRRPSSRRLAIAAGVWATVVAAAIGVAVVLDSPPAPAPPAPVSVAPPGLPLLRLYLDRDLPPTVGNLDTAAEQVAELQRLATENDDPARWAELGAIAQRAGDLVAAQGAFTEALRIEPERLDATVGLAMNVGATGPDGLARAAEALAELERQNPRSQMVVFNRGLVAVYRSDAPNIARAFRRVIELGPGTPLGTLSRQFVGAAPSQTP